MQRLQLESRHPTSVSSLCPFCETRTFPTCAQARRMSTARSISQVSRELVRLHLRGSVQTVFPARVCMQQSANSETQDYGTLGSDGPLEGAAKVSDELCLQKLPHESLRRVDVSSTCCFPTTAVQCYGASDPLWIDRSGRPANKRVLELALGIANGISFLTLSQVAVDISNIDKSSVAKNRYTWSLCVQKQAHLTPDTWPLCGRQQRQQQV